MLKKAMTLLILAAIKMTVPAGTPPQDERFRPVKGSGLAETLGDAARRAAAATQSPYWTAYTFDAISGAAADPDLGTDFNGRIEAFAGTEVFFGTIKGEPARTPNLAVFMLHKPRTNSVARVEIRNLDKPRRPDGRPVYWLGRVSNAESLRHLRALAERGPSEEAKVRAAVALALHDDPSAAATLRELAADSPSAPVRSAAVYWLGHLKAEPGFLSDLAGGAAETRTRVRAVRAIALGKDAGAFASLRGVYRPDADRAVKLALIDSVANNPEKEAAASFLLDIAKSDPDAYVGRHAVYALRRFERDEVVGELKAMYDAESSEANKQQILYALGQMRGRAAAEKLFEVASHDRSESLRGQARYFISERIGKRRAEAAEAAEAAGVVADDDGDLRAEAEFKKEAERVIRDRPRDEAVSFLINAARTHPDPKVRKRAMQHLIKIDDPRVVEFFRELSPE